MRNMSNALPLSLQSCNSWIIIKNQDRKKSSEQLALKLMKLSWRKLYTGQLTSSHVHLMLVSIHNLKDNPTKFHFWWKGKRYLENNSKAADKDLYYRRNISNNLQEGTVKYNYPNIKTAETCNQCPEALALILPDNFTLKNVSF